MSIDEIRRLHYKGEGREEGIEEGIEIGEARGEAKAEKERKQLVLKQYSKGLSIEYIADINDFEVEYVRGVVTE